MLWIYRMCLLHKDNLKCDQFLGGYNFNMTELKVESIEAAFDSILEAVGNDSFVNWEIFTKNSSETMRAIDEMSKALSIFREAQHRAFINTMKKLKGLDVPDLIKTVKAKKLPKEALRAILPKFALKDGKVELIEAPASLKESADKEIAAYTTNNTSITQKLSEYANFINGKIAASGYVPEPVQEQKEITSTVSFNISPEKVQQIASNVQLTYLPNTQDLIGIKTYVQIVEGSYELVKGEFNRITIDARKKQRSLIKQPKEYLEAMLEYLTNTEALIIEGQKLIASKVGVTPKKFEESEITLMERGLAQNILMIQSSLRARVKQSATPTQDVSLEVAVEVIKYQIDLIGDKFEPLRDIFAGLEKTQESVQMIPMMLALFLNDMVFDKFGYEEEDFMKNVGESVIISNPQLHELFKNMEIAIIKLMQRLEIIPQNVGQYMLQATQQREGQASLPGMMPGSNSMDLLQNQQLQQMQQMQQMYQMQQMMASKK